MKFKTQAEHLAKALSLASMVHPAPVDSQGAAGYLLVVRGEVCYIYSDDEQQKTRVEIPIFDVEGEGAFVYPAGKEAVFQYLDGWVELEAVEENGAFSVKFHDESGTLATNPTFDARAIQSLDRDLTSAKEGPEFPAVLLREAISLGKGYLADVNASKGPEFFKCFQMFDESKEAWKTGNGHLFAANGLRAFYFHSPAFEGKSLNVHSNRVGLLTSFLSKSKGDIKISRSERSTYIVNGTNHVVGWSDPVYEHEKFNYYPLDADSHVFKFSRDAFLKILHLMRTVLSNKKSKVRFQYDPGKGLIQLLASDNGSEIKSKPFGANPVGVDDGTEEFPVFGGAKSKTDPLAFNVNIDFFMELFAPLKDQTVELRISSAKAGSYFLRTVEHFYMDPAGKIVTPTTGEEVHSCRVTRFMTSMK